MPREGGFRSHFFAFQRAIRTFSHKLRKLTERYGKQKTSFELLLLRERTITLAESWGFGATAPPFAAGLATLALRWQTTSPFPQIRALSGSNPRTDHEKSEPLGLASSFTLAESWGFEPQIPFWGILA